MMTDWNKFKGWRDKPRIQMPTIPDQDALRRGRRAEIVPLSIVGFSQAKSAAA